MPKIHLLQKKDKVTGAKYNIYPATIPQAVIDPENGDDIKQLVGRKLSPIEEVTAQAIVAMQSRIIALEKIITDGMLDKIQVLNLDIIENFNVWGSTNLILTGETAPSVIPDFVGQTYINTVAKVAYTATGNSSVSDWK